MDDNALFLLLVGMLAYKGLDLAAAKYKLQQSLLRFSALIDNGGHRLAARRYSDLKSIHVSLRKSGALTSGRQLIGEATKLDNLNWAFPICALCVCLFVFLALGTAAVATGTSRNAELGKLILAVATTIVSAIVSVFAMRIERFRLNVERARPKQ